MSAHTPGPWTFELESGTPGKDDNDIGGIYGPEKSQVCWFGNGTQYYPSEGKPPTEADAHLIAAAPELLDALRQWAWAEANGDEAEIANARLSRDAAIAKAEGRA